MVTVRPVSAGRAGALFKAGIGGDAAIREGRLAR